MHSPASADDAGTCGRKREILPNQAIGLAPKTPPLEATSLWMRTMLFPELLVSVLPRWPVLQNGRQEGVSLNPQTPVRGSHRGNTRGIPNSTVRKVTHRSSRPARIQDRPSSCLLSQEWS